MPSHEYEGTSFWVVMGEEGWEEGKYGNTGNKVWRYKGIGRGSRGTCGHSRPIKEITR